MDFLLTARMSVSLLTGYQTVGDNGLKSHPSRKPKGKPMPEAMSRANGRRSKVRSAVEHVFARQKDKMKLFIRTILWPASAVGEGEDRYGQIAYNMLSYVWLTGKPQAHDAEVAERPECTPPRRQITIKNDRVPRQVHP
jgi:hypothetical protein